MHRVFLQITNKLPIGTKVKLKDSDIVKEICGFKTIGKEAYLLFTDGTDLHMAELDKISEVLMDES